MAATSHPAALALANIADRMDRAISGRGNHPAARRLHAEVSRLRNGATALDNLRNNRSPLDTPAAHALKVSTAAKKFDREITAVINRSGEAIRDGLQDIQRRIDDKINLKPDAFASEIRATFRTMTRRAKIDLLRELVDANRGPELAAIIKAPAILSGITDAECAQFEKAMIAKHAPAELDEREWLNEQFETSLVVSQTSSDLVRNCTDPSEIARIERDHAVAAEAGAAFEQSIQ